MVCKVRSCKSNASTKKGLCSYHCRNNEIVVKKEICKMLVFHKNTEYTTTFDVEDLDKVKGLKWSVVLIKEKPYVFSTNLSLHRFIMGTPKGFDTDHENKDTLNNCKINLRISTRSQNLMN